MTDDIIEQLKIAYKYDYAGQDMYLEAIDEIERLRSINRALIDAYESICRQYQNIINKEEQQ